MRDLNGTPLARWIVSARRVVVVAVLAATAGMALRLPEFGIDAGSNSLLLETDPDLRFYEETRNLFGSDEYVLVAFRHDDLFSDEAIEFTGELCGRLGQIAGVGGVVAYTTVPLLRSHEPTIPFDIVRTLPQEDVDRVRAREELVDNEVFGGFLLSDDASAACIVVTLYADPQIRELMQRMWELDETLEGVPEDDPLRQERARAQATYNLLEDSRKADRVRVVTEVRQVLAEHPDVEFFESGIPIINVDMVAYVDQDIRIFGSIAAGFFLLILAIVFRRVRWVLLPLVTCLITVVWVLALMAIQGKKTTVVTSNISSLLFILGIEHALHLVERYRLLLRTRPGITHHDAIVATIRELWAPALFTGTTTIAGFASLVISDIRPVIDFGIYMAIGVGISFLLSFTFFPAALALWRPMAPPKPHAEGQSGFGALARFTIRTKWATALVSLLVLGASIWGIFRLNFETRFVDYFRADSEISRGLFFVDQRMGGTTSLEVILTHDEEGHFSSDEGLAELALVEERLRAIPEVGKIDSIYGIVAELGKKFERTDPAQRLQLASRFEEVQAIIRGYATEDFRTARVFARLRETAPTLQRNRLIREVREFLESQEDLEDAHPRLTGIFVLYANLLNSLIGSQVKTFSVALAAIVLMLAVLFRSWRVALLGLIPNALPILFVLGFMGWVGIHLDMMTVTIASISLGIAVDGTIHYVFRHRREWEADGDYEAAMVRSHESVGAPVLWTSLSVMVAFCVLALSAFKPTMYFGLLTALAMFGGLFGSLTVLPVCLLIFKPYGRRDKITPPL